MTAKDVEAIYEAIAKQIDQVAEEKRQLYLAKLSLLLAKETGDTGRVLNCIKAASAALA